MGSIQLMSDAEKEIMKLIWDNGGSIFISELLEKVEESGRGWKRTTVRTFLTRLMEKGLLTAVRRGKNCEYRAAVFLWRADLCDGGGISVRAGKEFCG